jgi:hypothetical protein
MHVACASTGGRILTFEIGELKALAKGGRGLTLIDRALANGGDVVEVGAMGAVVWGIARAPA